MNRSQPVRQLERVVRAIETSDGAGVKLRRSIGARPDLRLDPFLLLDEFGTDNPQDYIAGFPPHPHRGFETVTYMIDGHMRHEDHLGHVGELRSGGVQWMTAGRGVIHSEMPQQESGRMRGFQLWINLPARDKMKPAGYRDIPAGELTRLALDGGELKLIAGRLTLGGRPLAGPINGTAGSMATDPLYVDLELQPGQAQHLPVPAGHNAFVYAFEGSCRIDSQPLSQRECGILGATGEGVAIEAGAQGVRLILVAGKPLAEPVVQYGPFVMNTREEIEQALADYRAGTLTG